MCRKGQVPGPMEAPDERREESAREVAAANRARLGCDKCERRCATVKERSQMTTPKDPRFPLGLEHNHVPEPTETMDISMDYASPVWT